MDSVVVLSQQGSAAPTQTFSNAQAELLSAAAVAASDQALQSTLVFSVNTAAYATAGCATKVAPCGTPTYLNGPTAVSVAAYGHQGTTPAANTTTQGVNLLLGNPDAWIVTQTLGAGSDTASSATGFTYVGGQLASVSVSAVPVLYSGLTIASARANYGTAACDASGSAQRLLPMLAPVTPSRAWTVTFPRTGTGTAHIGDVNNYEFNAAVCTAANTAGGEGASIASAAYTSSATAPTGFAFGSVIPVMRLDDRAPGTPLLMQNPRVRQNGWLNAQVVDDGAEHRRARRKRRTISWWRACRMPVSAARRPGFASVRRAQGTWSIPCERRRR